MSNAAIMPALRILLLPALLALLGLSGCASAPEDSGLSFQAYPPPGSDTGRLADEVPNPPAGSDYYNDNWVDSGNGQDHGLFSNW